MHYADARALADNAERCFAADAATLHAALDALNTIPSGGARADDDRIARVRIALARVAKAATAPGIPAPVVGPRHGPSLSEQLRLARALIGTDDKGGRDDARACIDRAAYVSTALREALAIMRHHAAYDDEGDQTRDGFDAMLACADAALALAGGAAPQTPAADALTRFLCVGLYDDGSRFADYVEAATAEDAEAIAAMNWPAIELWAGFIALRDGVMTVEG